MERASRGIARLRTAHTVSVSAGSGESCGLCADSTSGDGVGLSYVERMSDDLRSIIREELERAFQRGRIAMPYDEAARAVGLSHEMLRQAVRRNELVPKYAGTKPLFTPEELRRWVESLPDEPVHHAR